MIKRKSIIFQHVLFDSTCKIGREGGRGSEKHQLEKFPFRNNVVTIFNGFFVWEFWVCGM